jgi:hypothetical protein
VRRRLGRHLGRAIVCYLAPTFIVINVALIYLQHFGSDPNRVKVAVMVTVVGALELGLYTTLIDVLDRWMHGPTPEMWNDWDLREFFGHVHDRSNDPLTRWIIQEFSAEYPEYAMAALTVARDGIEAVDAMAATLGWCKVYRSARADAAAAGMVLAQDREATS